MSETSRNDNERVQWVNNNEGLYMWWRTSRKTQREFVREDREAIDEAIDNVLYGRRKQHYLAYPDSAYYKR